MWSIADIHNRKGPSKRQSFLFCDLCCDNDAISTLAERLMRRETAQRQAL